MRFFWLSLIFINSILFCVGQELIINPSAESNPNSSGWTIVSAGTNCYTGSNWRITGNQNGFPAAQHGSRYFFSGCGAINGEIYQDVNVSSYATDIDAGNQEFTFLGYTRSYNQAPVDGARMIVEYRSAASTVLGSYDTGYTTNTLGWILYGDIRLAPVGTRTIRIRLLSLVNSGSSVDGYFDNLSLTTQVIVPLPVGLVDFNATLSEMNDVSINWSTSSEINNDYFTIERSEDGLYWEEIQIVSGSGNSSEMINYSILDRSPLDGLSYYRLKQTDFDGKFSYSGKKTIVVVPKYNAYPNPIRGEFFIEGNSLIDFDVQVYTIHGQNVTNEVKVEQSTGFKLKFDFTNLESGFYFIRFKAETLKVFKL
jgi:hypothetical protein